MQGPLREGLRGLERGLLAVPGQLPRRPDAIVVVSAHWETHAFTVTSAVAPGMVYDYSGFPSEMYRIRYPSPGQPALAQRMVDLLGAAGCPAATDAQRGYDHSTYSVLQTMYPQADIPVVQLSLHAGLDPALHIRAGTALAPLRDENILIIGSGMTCHERGPEMAAYSGPLMIGYTGCCKTAITSAGSMPSPTGSKRHTPERFTPMKTISCRCWWR